MRGFWHVKRSFYDGDPYVALPGNIKQLDMAIAVGKLKSLTLAN
jgi:hypothetical protein